MDIRRLTLPVAAILIIAVAGMPVAFAQKAQSKTIDDMSAFREQIEAIKNQIDPVLNSLNGIVTAADANPVPAYKTYSNELKKMDSQVDKARKMRAELQKKGDALFKEWEKKMGAITNPDIKAKATENRNKLQQLYGTIEPDIANLKKTGESFLNDLKDLDAYFQVDLTSSGIASMTDTITKANSEGGTVKQLLDKILSTLDQVKAQLAPGGTGQSKK